MSSAPNSTPATGSENINQTLPYILYGAFISTCFLYAALIASGLLQGVMAGDPIEFPLPLPVLIGALSLVNISAALTLGQFLRPPDSSSALELYRGILRKLILQCACLEAIAIYGLVAHILGLEPVPSIVVVGFALVCLATLMPGLRNQMDRLGTLLRDPTASGG